MSARQPQRIIARTIAFGTSALLAAGMLTWAPTVASGWNQGSAEATLWQLLNGARVNNGMAPLQQHGTLVGLARWRSADMLAKNYFSHTIAGCGCLVYAYYDSNGLNYVWGGENIGWNSGLDDSYSPVRVHEKFMSSPGHRANVLYRAFTHGGVGAAAADGKMFQGHVQNTRMYTELFLQAPSAPSAPAPVARQPAPAYRAPTSGGGTAPAARAAAAPKPKPRPTAKEMAVDAPTRPASATGLDGVAVLVADAHADMLSARLAADDALGTEPHVGSVKKAPAVLATRGEMRVAAAGAPASSGPFDGLIGALLGFILG